MTQRFKMGRNLKNSRDSETQSISTSNPSVLLKRKWNANKTRAKHLSHVIEEDVTATGAVKQTSKQQQLNRNTKTNTSNQRHLQQQQQGQQHRQSQHNKTNAHSHSHSCCCGWWLLSSVDLLFLMLYLKAGKRSLPSNEHRNMKF